MCFSTKESDSPHHSPYLPKKGSTLLHYSPIFWCRFFSLHDCHHTEGRWHVLEAFLMVLDAPHSWDRGLKASTENSITGLKWFLLAWIYTKWIYFHTVVLSVFNHPQDSKRSMKILMTDVPRRIQWSILFENPLLRFIFCVLLFVFSSLLQGNLKTSTAGSAYQAQLESQAKLHLRKQHSSWSSLTPLLASLLKWII